MNAALATVRLRLLFVAHLISLLHFTFGGTCWSAMAKRNGSGGRCTELLRERVSKEECCSTPSLTASFSEEEYDSGTLFFWRILGGGVKCASCRDSCEGVVCASDRKCALRDGTPRCVCASRCAEGKQKRGRKRGSEAAVCGTDGRTYRDVCRLRKQACRRGRGDTLQVAYEGVCQSSCDRITCSAGKRCLLDQDLVPHCAACAQRCPKPKGMRQAVCGTNGRTYQSACHLRTAACKKGRAIPIAYRGKCKAQATCSTVRCRAGQRCLRDGEGAPRCVQCTAACRARHMRGPVCGTDGRTYRTWCHLMQGACTSGRVVETLHKGECEVPVKNKQKNTDI